MIPIVNAADRPLAADTGTVPDVSGAMQNWFQPMTFTKVVKTVVGFKTFETPTTIDFRGVWQPLTGRQLMIKPEGERAWNWFQVHAEPGALDLTADDVITYRGVQYRVDAMKDYSLYGYIQYDLVEDYTGSGPT